jgi:transcription antitermination factor NusG
MDFWSETNWYAVQSKPHQENLGAASVAKLEAEVFLPRVRQEQRVCGVARIIAKSLFSGYFFARFCPQLLLDMVRYASGVSRVVGNSRFPIPVPDEIVAAIRSRVQEDGFIQLSRPSFAPGDNVSIEEGPFAGWMGKVEREWDDGRRVLILLDAIQQARLLIERRWLAAASLSP